MTNLEAQGKHIKRVKKFNHERHCIIETDAEKLYVIYKREYFNTFYKKFPDYFNKFNFKDLRGESINVNYLKLAMMEQVDFIVFIHPEKSYFIEPSRILNCCLRFNLIRYQDKINEYKGNYGKGIKENEKTYSFPIEIMEEW